MEAYEQANKAVDAVNKLLDTAHQATIANMKARPLKNAISSYNREDAIQIIHEYVGKYKMIINATSPITGRFVTYAENFYDDKLDDYIKTDLRFLILMIYIEAAAEYGLNKAVDKVLGKIFKKQEKTPNAK